MNLEKTIEQDVVQAMKNRDMEKVGVLRMVKAALGNYKIEKKNENLSDDEVLTVIQKQAKQRKESIDSFEKAGRHDLSEKEKKELAILQSYMPKELTDAELKTIIQKVVQATGAKTKADQGRVMKDLMPQVKGKADGKRVNEILAQFLT